MLRRDKLVSPPLIFQTEVLLYGDAMKRPLSLVCALVGIMFSASLHAQTPLPPRGPSLGTRPAGPLKVARPHPMPCWEEAGISKAAMDRRRQVQQNAHAQVEAVCADSSLTMQQKQERIREIHQQARQESEALITPGQQQALKACQQSRATGGGHPAIPHPGHGGSGPCGEMPSANQASPKETVPPGEEPQW
jgi:hypothetical protein